MDVRCNLRSNLFLPRVLGVFPYGVADKFVLRRSEMAYSLLFNFYFIFVVSCVVVRRIIHSENPTDLKSALIDLIESLMMALAIWMSTHHLVTKENHLNDIYGNFLRVKFLLERMQSKILPVPPWKNYAKFGFTWPVIIIIFAEVEMAVRQGSSYRCSPDTCLSGSTHQILTVLSTIAHIMCNIKIYGIAFVFTTFTDILGSCFESVNLVLATQYIHIPHHLFEDICDSYDLLADNLFYLHKIFSSTLLVIILNCFVKCTDNFYIIINGTDLNTTFRCATWMLVMIMILLVLVNSAKYPIKQASMYEWLMHRKMKNDIVTSAASMHTKLTLHLMRRRKPKFDLCGFMTLDNGLLGKILAATLTYSIVISQLSTSLTAEEPSKNVSHINDSIHSRFPLQNSTV